MSDFHLMTGMAIAKSSQGSIDECPKIRTGEVSAYTVPTDLPESDGTAKWDSTTIVIVKLTAGDYVGLGYGYANEAAAAVAKELIQKCILQGNAFDIGQLHSSLDRQTRNWGRPGLVSSAISTIDNCLWDLKARILNQPVVDLLGRVRESIPAYGSGGFTSYTEKQLVDQLTNWASEGMQSVKMKIGREPEKDLERVATVQKALRGKAELFVDANGAYDRKQALQKSRQFGDLGVIWFEEPVSSDDRIGLRLTVEHAPPIIRIAAGEYIYVLDDAKLLIKGECIDVLQSDITRCGGVTNFVKIGAACEMFHLPFSAHTSPSLHASVCCSVLPSMNVEYFHDHARIEKLFFDGAIEPVKGNLKPDRSRPGFGLELRVADAEKYKISSAVVA